MGFSLERPGLLSGLNALTVSIYSIHTIADFPSIDTIWPMNALLAIAGHIKFYWKKYMVSGFKFTYMSYDHFRWIRVICKLHIFTEMAKNSANILLPSHMKSAFVSLRDHTWDVTISVDPLYLERDLHDTSGLDTSHYWLIPWWCHGMDTLHAFLVIIGTQCRKLMSSLLLAWTSC